MKKSYFLLVCVLGMSLLLGPFNLTNDASAQTAADFYKGKVLRLVVPYAPGGGTDTFARMIASHLGRYLTGTVVVKNIPGGDGTYAYNTVYKGKPDGLTIAITDTGALVLNQLFKAKGVQFDFGKFNWLGRASWSKRVTLVAKDSPYQSLKDILMAPQTIKVAGTGRASGGSLTWVLLFHALNLPPEKVKMVVGYSSGKETMMAVMQKETDVTSLTEDTSYEFVKAGLVRAFVTVDDERSEFFPDVPTHVEQVNIPKEKSWPLDVYLDVQRLRRGFITAPGVPKLRVDFLRNAMAQCFKDEKLLAQAEKSKRKIIPLGGEEMEKKIREKIAPLSEQEISEFKHIALEKYY